ncbi:C1 family peptidase [Mycoplasma nasistruthionis]|uniref:Aminopeptidase n=1 Tax=Mycoplasma nasistruthionis TaxID=353852 RepID=A0A4Y6I853_9MOLU|nr:C1 family peptidase [Mycoplasma nasistruthionis]QDF65088.1 aminopeptidase [Mycoplasma nasistruthionis]
MDLKLKTLEKFANKFNTKSNLLLQNSVIKNGLKNTCINHKTLIKHDYVFDIETTIGEITMQSNSGRCWIFAALNVARLKAMKDLNVENFEFSENYLAFYDKLEKANTFLNFIIQNIDKPLNDRLVYTKIHSSVASDGGYWEWFVALLNKYGAVPKSIMPETFHSGNTTNMNEILDWHLKNGASRLHQLYAQKVTNQELLDEKEAILYEVYDIVSKCLGTPPTTFDYEYKDKDKKVVKIKNITPLEFFEKYVRNDFGNKINVLHDPRDLHPYGSIYLLKEQNSVYNDGDVKMVNIPLQAMKDAIIASLKDGVPVWFGCDVDPFKDSPSGILDPELYQYSELFTPVNNLNKADRIKFYNSNLNHAMAFVGVKFDEQNNTTFWKVENSWGDKYGKKGIFSMSDSLFDEYCFTAIVDAKYLDTKYQLDNPKVVEVELWDPLA